MPTSPRSVEVVAEILRPNGRVRASPPSAGLPCSTPDVYSASEIANAAGLPVEAVEDLIANADISTVDGRLVTFHDAANAVEAVRTGRLLPAASGGYPGVFGNAFRKRGVGDERTGRWSAVMSATLHATAMLLLVALTGVRLTRASDDPSSTPSELARLIFVATPGPDGGGGGGGLKMPAPPAAAKRAGERPVSNPTPQRVTPRPVEPPPAPQPPPPLENKPLLDILAPLVASPSDTRDVRGLLLESANAPPPVDSRGPGDRDGVGDGTGNGAGSGSGAGVGPGAGGGTGGGPYRPESGIAPPRLIYEAQASYPEAARRRGIEGDVILDVVVLANGMVGDIRILRGLGWGLDEQAVNAVRQWRFDPAVRFGEPVDVMVEVAVEFALR